MITSLLALVMAGMTTLGLTPVVRQIALRAGVVDEPDGRRKLQKQPIPLLGGVAVVLGWWAAAAVLRIFDSHFVLPGIALPAMVSLVILATIGVLDDIYRLRARWKLLGQGIAVFPLVMAGCRLQFVELGGHGFDLGMLSIPATVLWLVLGINSLNLLDGMDGMASVVSTTITLTMATVCWINGQELLAILMLPLAGSLLGFLAYNFPPARIYMGDAGSMVLGLALSLAGLMAAQAHGPATDLTTLAALMAIPLADTSLAIIRRSLSGYGFWHPDRAHIHHRLLDQGLSAPRVLTIVSALGAIWGAVVVVSIAYHVQWPIWSVAALASIFAVHFHVAGQYEWTMVTRRIGKSRLVNFALPTEAQLRAMSPDGVWQSLLARMRGLPIVAVSLAIEDAAGRTSHRDWADAAAPEPRAALEVETRSLANHRCRLRIEANDLPLGAAWSRLPQLLDCFAQFWADHPAAVDATVLSFEDGESLPHRSAAKKSQWQQRKAA